ncbi:MAG: DUF971 domain-containing protein [Pirellulales bacterium]
MRPTELSLDEKGDLRIRWDDGSARRYTPRQLREMCPCASCRERRSAPKPPPTQLTVLSPAETQPVRIAGMTPVGNYAYSIAFSDGHDTGIFTLERLCELGEPTAAE